MKNLLIIVVVVVVWIARIGLAHAFDVSAGPIYNNEDAKAKCPRVCGGMSWSGEWKTENGVSYCREVYEGVWAPVGLIKIPREAHRICPEQFSRVVWNGNWRTTIPNQMSVCGCNPPPPVSSLAELPDAPLLDDIDPRRGEQEPTVFRGMVDVHNRVRESVGLRNIVWSSNVAAVAQSWADDVATHGCNLQHSDLKIPPSLDTGDLQIFGENIAWAPGRTPAQIAQLWADERRDYDETTDQCVGDRQCGHYMIMTAIGAARIGCGKASCKGGEFWVCNYDGNLPN